MKIFTLIWMHNDELSFFAFSNSNVEQGGVAFDTLVCMHRMSQFGVLIRLLFARSLSLSLSLSIVQFL